MATIGTLGNMQDSDFMKYALAQAQKAYEMDEVPIGAIIVTPENKIIGQGHNLVKTTHDPSAHAEIIALREASHHMGTARLVGCRLYTTLEPCPMCAQAIAFARLHTLIYGADDPKGGGVKHGARIFQQASCHHKIDVMSGPESHACGSILKKFFQGKRREKQISGNKCDIPTT